MLDYSESKRYWITAKYNSLLGRVSIRMGACFGFYLTRLSFFLLRHELGGMEEVRADGLTFRRY